MKVLIACDKFKGSLSAGDVALAIQRGLGEGFEVELCPIADGGEGFVEAMLTALGGKRRSCQVSDALGRKVTASYGLSGATAIIEMAEASGLWRIAEEDRDILRASSAGTGQLIQDAISAGATKILMGLGGSATNDGGAGMAAVLGWQFLTESGVTIIDPNPKSLASLAKVDGGEAIRFPEIEVACDVENPLLGERGATEIYGPQKGAGPGERPLLEAFLAKLAQVVGGEDYSEVPGAGAAGGMGWGLMKFAGATLRPGFEIVADAVSLQERIAAADIVITGEGSLDAQSLEGKGPIGVARMARAQGKRVVAIAGQISPEVAASGLFEFTFSLADTELPLEELIANAAVLVEEEARIAAGMLIG